MSLKLAIFASGRGSNMRAILQSIADGYLDASVAVAVCNEEGAGALKIAREFGVTSICLPHSGMKRREHEEKVLAALKDFDIDFIVLAGYMRILSPAFLKSFKDPAGYFRVINIHPSLLPAFPGVDAYKDAFEAGVEVSGITVHLVDEEVDHGPILAQAEFARLPGDTLDSFRARGLAVEHQLYPKVLQQIAREGVRVTPRGSVTA